MANTLGKANPLRYRGYVYDEETRLYYLQSRYYDPALGRFINSDVYASTGQGFIGNNMFAYANNNPVCYRDSNGTSPFSALTFADYGTIHKIVQVMCVAEYGWEMEVYVKGPLGRGFLDLYDCDNNQYYEVKSINTANTWRTNRQMKKYDVSHIADKRHEVAEIPGSPTKGSDFVNGTFAYGIYDVTYKLERPGLITYKCDRNDQRTLVTAVALVLIFGIATGNVPAVSGAGALVPMLA